MTLGSLYYVILFVVAAAWLRHVHRFSRQADAAHNALFVEDHLRFIELVPENPYVDTLRNAIVAGFRKGGAADIDSQGGLLEFHHAPRFTQLLLLAIAFNELQTSRLNPMIGRYSTGHFADFPKSI